MDGGSWQSDFLQQRSKTRVIARILKRVIRVQECQVKAVNTLVACLISLIQVRESLVSVTQREAEVRHISVVWDALLFHRVLQVGQNLFCFGAFPHLGQQNSHHFALLVQPGSSAQLLQSGQGLVMPPQTLVY